MTRSYLYIFIEIIFIMYTQFQEYFFANNETIRSRLSYVGHLKNFIFLTNFIVKLFSCLQINFVVETQVSVLTGFVDGILWYDFM